MGSWKRTITSPFRKACTILSPQHAGGSGSSRSDDHGSGSVSDGGRKTPRARHQLKRSGGGAAAAVARGGDAVDSPSTAQLYGDVMACAYDDVQVMWSMLDNKARVLDAAAS